MELVRTGEETMREAFAMLEEHGIKPKFWSKVMELWGVKGRDYGEYIAPRATSFQAWQQLKYDPHIPRGVKMTLAKIEVMMVERQTRIKGMSRPRNLTDKEWSAMVMTLLCFPPNEEHHGLLETPLSLMREAGIKEFKSADREATLLLLLDFMG